MAMNNSLAEVHPELVSEWSEKNLTLTPDDITFGSNKKVWWRGACGHEWQASLQAPVFDTESRCFFVSRKPAFSENEQGSMPCSNYGASRCACATIR